MDVHHKAFPRKDYRKELYRDFRNLDENKELTCRDRHNEIHATGEIPDRPDIAFVRDALARARGLSPEPEPTLLPEHPYTLVH